MVPIHHLGLLAPSTLYTSQEISQPWTTPQVIPHTWETFSQRFTNEWSLKNPSTKTLSSNDIIKPRIEWCIKDMQVVEQWCTKKHYSKAQI